MKTYTKFLVSGFIKSFFNVFFVIISLVFILNILKEIEFFNNKEVSSLYPVYLSLISSPSVVFEMFPFVFLIATQFFFLKLFNNDEINVFKYSGLKNIKIISILSFVSFFIGILIITLFYSFSSNLQQHYLQIKNQFSEDKLYLAVINKNGLWIKDTINNQTSIINSSQIDNNFLINTFITEFDKNYKVIRNLKSKKINIKNKKWKLNDVKIYNKNNYEIKDLLRIDTNYDYKKIQSLYSNLSSLGIIQLFELRKNYKKLNYSLTDVNLQLLKICSYPFYLLLVAFFSSMIMFRVKRLHNTTFKISLGLFFSVIIYYINNFFMVMGSTERITIYFAILTPLIFLTIVNGIMLNRINDK